MKIASRDLVFKDFKQKQDDDEDLSDDSQLKLEHFKNMTNSIDWQIARSIYSTLTLKGRIAIDKVNDETSELIM